MKTNQIITLGLVAVGAVIVYNKFFKKPKTTSAPAEGNEMSNAGGYHFCKCDCGITRWATNASDCQAICAGACGSKVKKSSSLSWN